MNTFQVRHRRYGVFQGVEITQKGVAVCYHPAAESPEMGFHEFKTLREAERFISWANTIPTLAYTKDDLKIEPYDADTSLGLARQGLHVIQLEHWMRLLNINE